MQAIKVWFLTNETYSVYRGRPDFTSTDSLNTAANVTSGAQTSSRLPSLDATLNEDYLVFKRRVARYFDYRMDDFVLWTFEKRQNGTRRPSGCVEYDFIGTVLLSVLKKTFASRTNLTFYIETGPKIAKSPPIPGTDNAFVLLFLKYFDHANQVFATLPAVRVPPTIPLRLCLAPILTKEIPNFKESEFWLFEELKPGTIHSLFSSGSATFNELIHGDIIYVHQLPPVSLGLTPCSYAFQHQDPKIMERFMISVQLPQHHPAPLCSGICAYGASCQKLSSLTYRDPLLGQGGTDVKPVKVLSLLVEMSDGSRRAISPEHVELKLEPAPTGVWGLMEANADTF